MIDALFRKFFMFIRLLIDVIAVLGPARLAGSEDRCEQLIGNHLHANE